jgi:hypothetical protein
MVTPDLEAFSSFSVRTRHTTFANVNCGLATLTCINPGASPSGALASTARKYGGGVQVSAATFTALRHSAPKNSAVETLKSSNPQILKS